MRARTLLAAALVAATLLPGRAMAANGQTPDLYSVQDVATQREQAVFPSVIDMRLPSSIAGGAVTATPLPTSSFPGPITPLGRTEYDVAGRAYVYRVSIFRNTADAVASIAWQMQRIKTSEFTGTPTRDDVSKDSHAVSYHIGSYAILLWRTHNIEMVTSEQTRAPILSHAAYATAIDLWQLAAGYVTLINNAFPGYYDRPVSPVQAAARRVYADFDWGGCLGWMFTFEGDSLDRGSLPDAGKLLETSLGCFSAQLHEQAVYGSTTSDLIAGLPPILRDDPRARAYARQERTAVERSRALVQLLVSVDVGQADASTLTSAYARYKQDINPALLARGRFLTAYGLGLPYNAGGE